MSHFCCVSYEIDGQLTVASLRDDVLRAGQGFAPESLGRQVAGLALTPLLAEQSLSQARV